MAKDKNDAADAAPEVNAAELLKQREADDKEIATMVAGGLDHAQAVAALKHKKDFTARHAAVKAEQEKAAKK